MSYIWKLDDDPSTIEPLKIGGGEVQSEGERWRLVVPASAGGRYRDAQLHDYGGARGGALRWRPPLLFSVRARLSAEVRGTAGFGLWNNPTATFGGLPALPRAAWFFFGSSPGSLELAAGVPGAGWKGATIDAGRPRALAWAPLAP